MLDVFTTFIKPLLPKTQTDGSFKDGNAELLDQLMTSPCLLSLPRAERLADLVKMAGGGEWTAASMARARDFFALEAAGVSFLLYIPTITHRQQLSWSPFFRLERGGEVVGVRDCCPDCRSNEFIAVTKYDKIVKKYDKDRLVRAKTEVRAKTDWHVAFTNSSLCSPTGQGTCVGLP